MPRFYLHTHDGVRRIEDQEGSDLADLASARAEALESARHLWAAAIIADQDLSSLRFEIADENGRIVLTLPFVEALPAALRGARQGEESKPGE